jgi:hypothetical protein
LRLSFRTAFGIDSVFNYERIHLFREVAISESRVPFCLTLIHGASRKCVEASSSTRCQISTAIGRSASSMMCPTSPIARAITPKPLTMRHGKPNSQQIAPIAPVALMGSDGSGANWALVQFAGASERRHIRRHIIVLKGLPSRQQAQW